MKKIHYLWYLLWLLPAGLLALGIHQSWVYFGMQNTYNNGEEYVAEVLEFRLKSMQAQSNGYIVLEFTTTDEELVNRRLSLPIQMASRLMETEIVTVRYLESSSQDVVIAPVYSFHRSMVLSNIGVIFLSFVVTFIAAFFAHRYAERLRTRQEAVQPEFVFKKSHPEA